MIVKSTAFAPTEKATVGSMKNSSNQAFWETKAKENPDAGKPKGEGFDVLH